MSQALDLMEMLAQASTFSRGVPVKRDENIWPIKVSKSKKERSSQKNIVKTADEEMYRHYIGYGSEEDDGFLDDFNNTDVNDFENETLQNNLSSRLHSRNRYKNKPNNAIKANNNLTGIGRGRVLKSDFINTFSSYQKVDRSRSSLESNRQALNDQVISEQLREVMGSGNSNEEIEKSFNQIFRKNAQKNRITVKQNLYSEDDLSSISSCNSVASSKKSNKSVNQPYIPPPLRSRNNVESSTTLDDYKNDSEDSSVIGWRANENIEPINLYRYLPPMECIASKVENIYEISDDIVNGGSIKKKNENTGDDSSDEDVKIVEVTEHSSDEIPKMNLIEPEFQFKVKVKEKDKSFKSVGRNALINALLKKNADSLPKQSPEPEEKVFKAEVSDINYFEEKNSNSEDESSNDVILNLSNLSHDPNEGTESSDCGDFIYFSSSDLENSSKSSSPIGLKFNSPPINCSPVKKTYTESIMDKNRKNNRITLGDFLSPDSLSSSETSSFNNSTLNPEALSFLPSFIHNDSNDKSSDFNLQDYNSFPPL